MSTTSGGVERVTKHEHVWVPFSGGQFCVGCGESKNIVGGCQHNYQSLSDGKGICELCGEPKPQEGN